MSSSSEFFGDQQVDLDGPFVGAPPPAENPWTKNTNAASIICPKMADHQRAPVDNDEGESKENIIGGKSEKKQQTKGGGKEKRGDPSVDWPELGESLKTNGKCEPIKNGFPAKTTKVENVGVKNPAKKSEGLKLQNGPGKKIEKGFLSNATNEKESSSTEHSCNEDNDKANKEDGKKNSKKTNKQKWVPLDLHENDAGSMRSRRKPKSKIYDKSRDTNNNSAVSKEEGSSEGRNSNPEGNGGSSRNGTGRGRGARNQAQFTKGAAGRGSGGKKNGTINGYGGELDVGYLNQRRSLIEYAVPPLYTPEYVLQFLPHGYYSAFGAPIAPPIDTTGYMFDDHVIIDMIRKQIEYYFSVENLTKDFFLRSKMDENGYLEVDLIANFPRVQNLCQDVNIILTSIQTSSLLELSDDFKYVRTAVDPEKWPVSPSPNGLGGKVAESSNASTISFSSVQSQDDLSNSSESDEPLINRNGLNSMDKENFNGGSNGNSNGGDAKKILSIETNGRFNHTTLVS